jgi:hypothetical protein
MINPCNSEGTYIQFDPSYNLPTYYGTRARLQYEKPTPEIYAQRKLLILKNTYVTNGPGTQFVNPNARIPYRLDIDSVQYKNTIFRIPCRFQKFIDLIKIFLNEGKSIQNIFNYLSITYNIQNIRLNKSTYQLKPTYRYTFVNVDAPKNDENSINNSAPYKIGESLASFNLQPIIDDIVIARPAFITSQYATKIYVSKNDGVNNYTNKFNDLLPNGSASFFGALLLKNYVQDSDNFHLRAIIVPQFTNYYKSYGYIVDSTNYNIPNLTGLICIPIQVYALLMLFKPYPFNMPFTVNFTDINVFTPKDDAVVPCKYSKYIPFTSNQVQQNIAVIDNL